MAKNPERRHFILDAGLRVLAEEGSRGLTHRAIDRQAGLPEGTCANYFKTRDALMEALGERIFERLTPTEAERARSAEAPPSRARLVDLMKRLVERVNRELDLQRALLELRLEAMRRPKLRTHLANTLRRAVDADLAFHEAARLPGGRFEIVLLHLAFEGLILNTVTLPEVLDVAGRDDVTEALTLRLVIDD
ncbi:MAG: TetR family transcriptional regulator [Myxococcota bacterium]